MANTTVQHHPRPGRATRSVTYPAVTRHEGVVVVPGTQPIWLYLRLSRAAGDVHDAIERHRLDLTRQLDAAGCWAIMGEFIDNDSASKSAARTRKGWTALNHAIDSGTVTAVAFWKLDRCSRVALKSLEWIAHCRTYGVELVSHQDSATVFGSDASGKLMAALSATLAEIETDTMSERQLGSKRHAAEAGFNHGGTVPFGWQLGARVTDDHGRTGTRLVQHPVEFPALTDAVRLTLAGQSLAVIARYWRDKYGITAASGQPAYITSILRALRSPRLMGYRMRNVPEHQRGVALDLMDYVVRGSDGEPVTSQPPVCDRATWLQLQRALTEARNSPARLPWGSIAWLLTGVVSCGTCEHPLYGNQKQVVRAGVKTYRHVYRCESNRRIGAGTCATGCQVAQDLIEPYVFGWLVEHLAPAKLAAARARQAQRTPAVNDALTEARLERDALLDQQGSAKFRGAMVGVLLGLLADVTDRIEALERAEGVTPISELPDGEEIAERWPTMLLAEKRQLLRRVIADVQVGHGRGSMADRVTDPVPRVL